jgi:metal-responsive CopG/Arc/MetJ family transcriptional regulator
MVLSRKALAKKPARYRRPLTITLPSDLLKQLETQVEHEQRSRSKIVEMALRKHIEEAATT